LAHFRLDPAAGQSDGEHIQQPEESGDEKLSPLLGNAEQHTDDEEQ
jgi:hypothetical protein